MLDINELLSPDPKPKKPKEVSLDVNAILNPKPTKKQIAERVNKNLNIFNLVSNANDLVKSVQANNSVQENEPKGATPTDNKPTWSYQETQAESTPEGFNSNNIDKTVNAPLWVEPDKPHEVVRYGSDIIPQEWNTIKTIASALDLPKQFDPETIVNKVDKLWQTIGDLSPVEFSPQEREKLGFNNTPSIQEEISNDLSTQWKNVYEPLTPDGHEKDPVMRKLELINALGSTILTPLTAVFKTLDTIPIVGEGITQYQMKKILPITTIVDGVTNILPVSDYSKEQFRNAGYMVSMFLLGKSKAEGISPKELIEKTTPEELGKVFNESLNKVNKEAETNKLNVEIDNKIKSDTDSRISEIDRQTKVKLDAIDKKLENPDISESDFNALIQTRDNIVNASETAKKNAIPNEETYNKKKAQEIVRTSKERQISEIDKKLSNADPSDYETIDKLLSERKSAEKVLNEIEQSRQEELKRIQSENLDKTDFTVDEKGNVTTSKDMALVPVPEALTEANKQIQASIKKLEEDNLRNELLSKKVVELSETAKDETKTVDERLKALDEKKKIEEELSKPVEENKIDKGDPHIDKISQLLNIYDDLTPMGKAFEGMNVLEKIDKEIKKFANGDLEVENRMRQGVSEILKIKEDVRKGEKKTTKPEQVNADIMPKEEKQPYEMTKAEYEKQNPIISSAYKMPDGKILTGTSHPDIANKTKNFNYDEVEKTIEAGFITRDGKFINRDEALNLTGKNIAQDIGNVFGIKEVPHKKLVEQAIAEGKQVPPEVLKDYPELKPRETTNVQ